MRVETKRAHARRCEERKEYAADHNVVIRRSGVLASHGYATEDHPPLPVLLIAGESRAADGQDWRADKHQCQTDAQRTTTLADGVAGHGLSRTRRPASFMAKVPK